MVFGNAAPIAVDPHRAAAVPARFLIPFGGFGGDALFVSFRRIRPFAVDLHRTAANVARTRRPQTFFMIIGNVVPLSVNAHRGAAMKARFVLPLCRLALAAFRVNSRRIVPRAANPHRAAANGAILFLPRAIRVVFRRVVPIFVNADVAAAVPARDVIPFGHKPLRLFRCDFLTCAQTIS